MKKAISTLITFGLSTLPAFTAQDSARLPITLNASATITATPISMIEGSNPSNTFTLSLNGNSTDTLHLPVDTDDNTLIIQQNTLLAKDVHFTQNRDRISLVLPHSFVGSELILRSISGAIIGRQNLSEPSTHSLSLWETAAGVYLLTVGKGEQQFSKKVSIPSGGCRIQTDFNSTTGGISSRSIRASTASYQLKISSKDALYNDSTITVTLDRGINAPKMVTLSNKSSSTTPLTELIDSLTYEKFFPNRYSKNGITGTGKPDFYTYRSFIDAVAYLSDFEATVYNKPSSGGDRVVVKKKSTKETHEYITVGGYMSNSSTETSRTVDYAKLFSEGSQETIRQELAAYFANASQETTGGWPSATPSQWAWGLCYVHESPLDETTKDDRFTDDHAVYGTKATLEWSYHGRGPKQLTYNYNYGMLSDFIFFDKSTLLNDPNMIARDAKLAWVSSLWFWNTPQGRKPSCHEVMVGTWQPTSEDISAGRTTSKFGMTINIINGGVECGFAHDRARQRGEHYKYFSNFLSITPETDCGCDKMQPY